VFGPSLWPPGWPNLHEAPRAQRTVLAEWSPGLDPGPRSRAVSAAADPDLRLYGRSADLLRAIRGAGEFRSGRFGRGDLVNAPGGSVGRPVRGAALAAARRRFSLCAGWRRTKLGSGGFERLVPVGCGDCSLSTSGLSTWWSTTALDETWF
jgi:hypothetical protein